MPRQPFRLRWDYSRWWMPDVSWEPTHHAVALSSAESELYAQTTGAIEAMGLQNILREVGIEHPISVYAGSIAARSVMHAWAVAVSNM